MSEPCSSCAGSLDCPNPDEMFPYSLTGNAPFPFIIVCPTNANCYTAPTVRLTCCSQQIQVVIPTDATQAQREALVQSLLTQCRNMVLNCTTPPSDNPNDPPDSPPFPPGGGGTFYYSNSRWQELTCSDAYGGGTYRFTLGAGYFVGFTQQIADNLAAQEALRLARLNQFCLNAPCLCPCKDVATTINISTVGGYGPFTFSITSGTLPTGLSMAVVGGVLRVTGTPTVAGSSTITVKVNDDVGGYLTKTLTFYVLEILTSTLSPFDVGTPYSAQIVGVGGSGDYTFEIVDGELPTGLEMSPSGLITGTPTSPIGNPFTVSMTDDDLEMESGCEKELLFQGGPTIYYKLETTAGAIAIDAAGDDDTDTNVGSRDSVAGKILQGWQWPYAVGDDFSPKRVSRVADNTIIDSKTITIRFWVKIIQDLWSWQGTQVYTQHQGIITRYFTIHLIEGAGGDYTMMPEVRDYGSAGDSTLYNLWSTINMQDFEWHHVVFTYDEVTGDAKLYVDNTGSPDPANVPVSDIAQQTGNFGSSAVQLVGDFVNNFGVIPPYSAGGFNYPGFPSGDGLYGGIILDEVCVIPGAAWSAIEVAYDYNGGTGRTYPDLP